MCFGAVVIGGITRFVCQPFVGNDSHDSFIQVAEEFSLGKQGLPVLPHPIKTTVKNDPGKPEFCHLWKKHASQS